MIRRWRPLFCCLAILSFASGARAGGSEWQTNWKDAFRIAKQERKLVFVDFYADWCGPCRMMEKEVFPTADVQSRFRDYVLLRVDVDRSPPGVKLRARALPTYIIYDYDGRDRFHFFGAMPAPQFLERLDLAREAMPFMLRAAGLFEQKEDVLGWMEVAKGYSRVQAAEQSRDAWQRAEICAAKAGDHVAVQVAAINAALTWVIEGKASKSVTLLKKIAASPVDSATEGLSWFVLGQAYVAMKDTTRAREAFEKAKSLVARDHAVAVQADAALAQLP